jgi:hypothetical protein
MQGLFTVTLWRQALLVEQQQGGRNHKTRLATVHAG